MTEGKKKKKKEENYDCLFVNERVLWLTTEKNIKHYKIALEIWHF